jgi:translation initiation factor IF-2
VTGLSGVPEAGQVFFVVADEKTAKDISSHFQKENKEKALAKKAKGKGGLEAWLEGVQEGNVKELKVIVKADVQGSVEAVSGTLMKLGNEEVRVEIIHSAVGGITKNDVNLAASSPDGAVIVGFNVRPEARTAVLAEEKGIELILHSVIYDVEAVIKGALEGMLDPILSEEVIGRIDIREIFSVPKIGTVAGCFVQDGIVKRGSKCRLVRDGKIVYTSTIGTLRRFKDDVKEVKGGFECGLSISNYNDIKQGDKVEVFQINEEAAKLS